MSRWMCVDRDGWPVETIKRRRFTSLLRLLIHTRRIVRAERCLFCGGWIPVTTNHDCTVEGCVGTAATPEGKP